jgi:hypothetical protein
MNRWMKIAILAALAGGAGVQAQQRHDLAAGAWRGAIDGEGGTQPLNIDLDQQSGGWRGEWRSFAGSPSKPLQSVDVQGDQVRFETDKLRFVGQVSGSKLSGTVSRKADGDSVGEFSVVHDVGGLDHFSPASEPSFPLPTDSD